MASTSAADQDSWWKDSSRSCTMFSSGQAAIAAPPGVSAAMDATDSRSRRQAAARRSAPGSPSCGAAAHLGSAAENRCASASGVTSEPSKAQAPSGEKEAGSLFKSAPFSRRHRHVPTK